MENRKVVNNFLKLLNYKLPEYVFLFAGKKIPYLTACDCSEKDSHLQK